VHVRSHYLATGLHATEHVNALCEQNTHLLMINQVVHMITTVL
jgi:hypothetical protein